MGNQVIQPSLTGGEMAPGLWARVDMARYQISLKTCRNFVVQPYGGVKNRTGTRLVCEVKDSSKPVRLIPFTFNADQTYVLEAGNQYLRVIRNGGQVVYSSGGSAGLPVEVVTPYLAADLPTVKFTQSADVVTLVHSSYAPKQLGRTAHDAWSMSDFAFKNGPWAGQNYDRSIGMTVSGTSGTITVTSTKDVFSASDVGRLLYIEQKDFGQPWEVGKTITVNDVRRSDGKYYRAVNSGTTGTLRPTHSEDTWSDGGVTWLYLHSSFGTAKITAYTDAKNVTAQVVLQIPEAIQLGGTLGGVKTLTAASQVLDYLVVTAVAHGLGAVGTTFQANVAMDYVTWDSGFSSSLVTVSVSVASVDTLNVYWAPPGFVTFTSGTLTPVAGTTAAAATYKWALGAWGGSQGYPSCVSYHQQRQVFGGTPAQPQGIWTSRTGDFLDFGKSNPIQDDDPITKTVSSTRMDAIKSMHPMDALIVLTQGGEWAAGAGSADVLTPANMAFKNQGYCGASDLPVIGIGNTALFVQDKGQVVRDLAYEFASNTYAGNDLTAPAAHLTEGHQIVEWAFQQTPFRCVWMVRDDGVLLSMTYMREQQVIGWARHDTDGLYESVCVVGEGNEDVVYVVVKRTINGQTKRFIERMESRLVLDIKDAFFVDSGLSFDGRNTGPISITLSGGTAWDETETLTATASSSLFSGSSDVGDQLVFTVGTIVYRLTVTGYVSGTQVTVRPNRILPTTHRNTARTDWAWARDTFSGLSHLEGKTVSVLADGNVQDQKVVTGGKIALSPPATRVHVGLPIEADLETLDLSIPGIETLLPKNKAIPSVTFMVQETQSIWAGRTFSRLDQSKARSDENYDQPINMQTGKVQIRMDTNWGKSANVCLRVSDPVPVGILAIIPDVTVGGV